MDALPIQEKNDLPFASENAGAMHACGHDGHTAMLLAAARLLSERRGALRGAVKFMFQPAEEGGFGAVRMIENGVLEEPHVDAAFGLHVTAGRYAGEVAMRAGATMAAADRFEVEIKGRGGHAARPDQTVDPVVVAAHVITALQTIVSREVPSSEQAVVTVGNLEAGSTYNAIPEVATMKGTFRTFSEEVRAQIRRRLPELVSGIAAALRATATTKLIPGYPVLINPAEPVAFVRATVTAVLGSEALFDMEPAAGAEDFSYVLQKVPGAFFFLGVRDPAWTELRPNHSPRFDMDESALPAGAALLAATAMRFLARAVASGRYQMPSCILISSEAMVRGSQGGVNVISTFTSLTPGRSMTESWIWPMRSGPRGQAGVVSVIMTSTMPSSSTSTS